MYTLLVRIEIQILKEKNFDIHDVLENIKDILSLTQQCFALSEVFSFQRFSRGDIL